MKIEFYGAAQVVTGSKHLITTRLGTKVLLDCGLFQGSDQDSNYMNRHFGFTPHEVDYVILSHAHIDHTGLLPRLVNEGFKGKIFCTPATKGLCEIMLMDSAHIQEMDVKYVNVRRKKRGEELLDPLYDEEDVNRTLAHFVTVPYRTEHAIDDEISFHYTDAGHILGSTAVHLTIKEERDIKLTFTGDIGRPGDIILRSPEEFRQADYIISESTYGDRLHEPIADTRDRLLKVVHETCVERGGKLVIPAFSVDRTQELIYQLDQLSSAGKLPPIKVFVDSPLSVKATMVMKEHDECFNPDILEYIEKDGDAFGFPNLFYVSKVEDSKKINDLNEPCIIISASGMAEAGRIKHHIANTILNPNNTILIVGYCSPTSLGGAIRRGDKEVRIFGEEYEVKTHVEVMESFSAHADYNEILEFLSCQNPAMVRKVFLVHGDYEAQLSLKEKLETKGFHNIEIPEMGEEFEVN
jgi:metallo-beta-lactamase family protein